MVATREFPKPVGNRRTVTTPGTHYTSRSLVLTSGLQALQLVLQPWRPSTSLKRFRYIGKLEPTIIAIWLRKEVGLTAHDVASRFRSGRSPFARLTDATVNPRKLYTDVVLLEIYPSLTDDSFPDFGADLEWTPSPWTPWSFSQVQKSR